MDASSKVAVISGASSGIGTAAARALSERGFRVVLGARRVERTKELSSELGGWAFPLDVRSEKSIEEFVAATAAAAPQVHLLVNNAGVGAESARLTRAASSVWRELWETNVLGLVLLTRSFIPLLRASGDGQIVNIGSIAGTAPNPGIAAYASTKAAVRSITQTLRLELNGEQIRICEIAPGLTQTEFAATRFKKKPEFATALYEGLTPLTSEDVAECIAFVATRPKHVNIDYLAVQPLGQASQYLINREGKV